jgi:dihydroorotate dehydrogenase (NAD+) catalytic subunit
MNLSVNIAGVSLKNPVMPASGTFGSGREFAEFVDLSQLGAVVTKGVAIEPWSGNAPCRLTETASGMLNSVGLQNAGIKAFLAEDLPFLTKFDTRIIVNICGHTVEEYEAVADALRGAPADMLELNISCPNVAAGGMNFGTDAIMAERVVSRVKQHAAQPLIVKLSPNVTDVAEIARAVESGGADAISLINTLLGMRIDIKKSPHGIRGVFALANKMGGLSGPAIKPVALRMVYQVSRAVKLPVIGMGGIMSAEDAVEFLMAGATAVAVGTANFHNPSACAQIVSDIATFMESYGIENINDIKGMLEDY